MKKCFFYFFALLASSLGIAFSSPSSESVPVLRISGEYSAANLEKSKIKSVTICLDDDEWISKVANIVNFDLDFTDQIRTDLKLYKKELTNKVLDRLFKQGISFCIAISKIENLKISSSHTSNMNELNHSLLVTKVYNTYSKALVSNYVVPYKEKDYIDTGHLISDSILKPLTGDSISLAKIAYCKTIAPTERMICVADYACKKENIVVSNKSINIAPSWHPWLPLIFYTQFTKSNNRLMSVNLNKGDHKVVTSFEGLNMQPVFSQNGRRVVLCLSVKGNSELYLYDHDESMQAGKKTYKQLTNNNANNVAPCLLADENIVFCSDLDSRWPQLYHLNTKNGAVRRLTSENYCVSPSYSKKPNAIVYSKYVNGVFQIFEMKVDLEGRVINNKQITFGPGDKQEPSWSPCGRYIAFTYYFLNNEGIRTSQIAIMNVLAKKIRIVSSGNDQKSYPVWRTV